MQAEAALLRNRTVHVSRTMMSKELIDLLDSLPCSTTAAEYERAIVEANALMKRTLSNRQKTLRFLRELYALDPADPVFAALCVIFAFEDRASRALLCLLVALFVDEVFRPTASPILDAPAGQAVAKEQFIEAVEGAYPGRFGEKSLDKIARNAGSSWTQSGHLVGRVKKVRTSVEPSPGVAAFAAYLGWLDGARGLGLLNTLWSRSLDVAPERLDQLLFRAGQQGLLTYRRLGDVLEMHFRPLEARMKEVRG